MILGSLADLVLGISFAIRREVGRSAREFAEFAAANPYAAALELDMAAIRLEAAAAARRRRPFSGRLPWLARRQLAAAARLRAQARDLRAHARGLFAIEPFRAPGTA